jgi:hypothetical protein
MRSGYRLQVTGQRAKVFLAVIIILFPVSCFLFPVYAAPTSSKELIDDAKTFDGRNVTYKGEAVTAIMKRGSHSWVNINDGDNAIGVWCEDAPLGAVKYVGDYKHKGDMVEIRGTFHRACPVHKGELDIHAENIRVLKQGFIIKENIDNRKMNAAAALLIITLFTTILFRRKT